MGNEQLKDGEVVEEPEINRTGYVEKLKGKQGRERSFSEMDTASTRRVKKKNRKKIKSQRDDPRKMTKEKRKEEAKKKKEQRRLERQRKREERKKKKVKKKKKREIKKFPETLSTKPPPPPASKTPKLNNTSEEGELLIAIQEYVALREDELSIKVNDIVTVVSKPEQNWWFGKLPNEKKGLFPITYCIKYNGPKKPKKTPPKIPSQENIIQEESSSLSKDTKKKPGHAPPPPPPKVKKESKKVVVQTTPSSKKKKKKKKKKKRKEKKKKEKKKKEKIILPPTHSTSKKDNNNNDSNIIPPPLPKRKPKIIIDPTVVYSKQHQVTKKEVINISQNDNIKITINDETQENFPLDEEDENVSDIDSGEEYYTSDGDDITDDESPKESPKKESPKKELKTAATTEKSDSEESYKDSSEEEEVIADENKRSALGGLEDLGGGALYSKLSGIQNFLVDASSKENHRLTYVPPKRNSELNLPQNVEIPPEIFDSCEEESGEEKKDDSFADVFGDSGSEESYSSSSSSEEDDENLNASSSRTSRKVVNRQNKPRHKRQMSVQEKKDIELEMFVKNAEEKNLQGLKEIMMRGTINVNDIVRDKRSSIALLSTFRLLQGDDVAASSALGELQILERKQKQNVTRIELGYSSSEEENSSSSEEEIEVDGEKKKKKKLKVEDVKLNYRKLAQTFKVDKKQKINLVAGSRESFNKHVNIVSELLNMGVSGDSWGFSTLQYLYLGGGKYRDELVSQLIYFNKDKLDEPLLEACYHNYFYIVKRLLDAGANPNFQDSDGNTPLIMAGRSFGNKISEAVEYLIGKGGDPKIKNKKGEDFLDICIDDDAVKLVRKKFGDFKKKNKTRKRKESKKKKKKNRKMNLVK